MTHICNLAIIGSDNGLSPGRHQAIFWTSAGILSIGPLGTNLIEILIGIVTFPFMKMHLKMSSVKRRPFCLGLNVLTCDTDIIVHLVLSRYRFVLRCIRYCHRLVSLSLRSTPSANKMLMENIHKLFFLFIIVMAYYKTAVSPVHYQWRYCSLALSHWLFLCLLDAH